MTSRKSEEGEEDIEALKEKREKNRMQRREFVKFWARYVKEHDDREWSQQQNLLINSQLEE